MKQLLIVIPTYNEAHNIGPLVRAIDSVLRMPSMCTAYATDILFVDDNSPDGTAAEIHALQSKLSLPRSGVHHIYLLSGQKQGLGKAYIRGLTYGLSLEPYEAIVTMDADLSHDPQAIPAMLAKLDDGADFVIGSRYVRGGRTDTGYSPLRRFQSTMANVLAKHLIDLKTDVADLTSGFKAMRSSSLATIPLQSITASGYVFMVSLLYEFAKRNYVIREIPITFHPRKSGTSKLGLTDMLEFLKATYQLNPSARLPRLIRFGSVGAIGALVNLGILVTLVRALHLSVVPSYLIALEASIISNFFLNHWFTFRFARNDSQTEASKGHTGLLTKLVRYNLVGLGGVAISWLVFSVAFRELGLDYIAADVAGIVAATSWNYWLSVRLVWRIIDTSPEDWSEEPQSLA